MDSCMKEVNESMDILDKKLGMDGVICTTGWSGGTANSFAVATPFE